MLLQIVMQIMKWRVWNRDMKVDCNFCKSNHDSMEKIKNCLNIRVNMVNSNLIMDGYEGERIKPIQNLRGCNLSK